MKKQKLMYRFYRYEGKVLQAKSEIPYEITLIAQLVLDQLCFTYNKEQLQQEINKAIDCGDEQKFKQLSEAYRNFAWE